MSAAPHAPWQNHILSALPTDEYENLLPHLESISLELNHTVYEAGAEQGYVYFPTTSIMSLLQAAKDGGAMSEIAVVANEGVVGIALFVGGRSTPAKGVVQCAGHAYRVKASLLKQKFERGGSLQTLLLRHTQSLVMQMAQSAICNQKHSIEQQLCRWLLLSMDRLPPNELSHAQELTSTMLLHRRDGVTAAASGLAASGAIHYVQERISVLDRAELEARVCDCYAKVKRESDRLFALPIAA